MDDSWSPETVHDVSGLAKGPDAELERKIELWKQELLDTGKRNKMINFRETKRSTLQILEPEMTELFNRLAFSGRPLTFQKPVSKDTDFRTYAMIALMETLSYPLDVLVGDIKTAGTVIEREKTLKNLRAKAKLAQEEQGTNILYVCFGFICWREQNRESSPWLKAPLLMMPVTLGRKSFSSPYTLNHNEDEIEVNPTLSYLFNALYHIELPPFDLKNRKSIEEYLARVEKMADRHGWRIVHEVSLGLFSFLKISMYHDLNDNQERILRHPVLRAMAGDREALADLPAGADQVDFDALRPENGFEIVDSDSSQKEAILLSKRGASFVMQGPPGTGKSQTITNIIAEALADGKKVLFVSEKAAALEVVLRRLSEAGLDDFCLSLHDYKANKKEIIDRIGANLNLEEEYTDRSDLSELAELFYDRAFLNEYADELHKPIEPLGQSVYSVFGRLANLPKVPWLNVSVEQPEEITKEQFTVLLTCVAAFEKTLRDMGGRLSENPWFRTKAVSSGQDYKMELQRETEGLSGALRQIQTITRLMAARLGMEETNSFAAARRRLEVAELLLAKPPQLCRGWFANGSARGRELAAQARQHAAQVRQCRHAVLSGWAESVLEMDPELVRAQLGANGSWMDHAGENESAEKCLADQRAMAESLRRRLEETVSAGREGQRLICCPFPDTLAGVRQLRRVLDRIGQTPFLEAPWLDARGNADSPLLDEAVRHRAAVRALSGEILRDWEPSALTLDAEGMLGRFKTEYVGLFHFLNAGYRQDMKTLRLHLKAVGGRLDDSVAVSFLQKLRELKAEKAWFAEHAGELSALAGRQYRGEETDWVQIRESRTRAIEIARACAAANMPEETVSAILNVANSLQLTGEACRLAGQLSEETRLREEIRGCSFIRELSEDSSISQDILPQIKAFLDNCDTQARAVAELAAARKSADLLVDDLHTLLSNLSAIQDEQRWFADQEPVLRELFMDMYQGPESNWEGILLGLSTAERLSALMGGSVPDPLIQMACEPVGEDFQREVSALSALVAETEPKLAYFSAQFRETDFEQQDLGEVADRYEACMNGFGELNKWLDYVETRAECDHLGLSEFTARIAELDNTVGQVQAAFEKGFYTGWLRGQLNHVPAVQSFRRRVHEQRRERFVELDVRQFDIARKRIREKIIRTYPDLNRVKKAGSELGILRHEMEKKRRIMPLRKLFRSIPGLLLTLKPCLMMSPLSVAYFLDAGLYQFDMVIFDEASQIFPQDAIGAIFRAKQVIIAGDTRQLPPTNFFAANTSNSSDSYDGDEEAEEMFDSILEETANILPNRTLLWHYRSRHEHLIAFSNQEIYHNELITFPSSNENEPDTGVEFVYVEEGVYDPAPKNVNIPEAQRIVALVKEHIEKHPDRSLGVIAFSEKQQQAIDLEIQRFRETHPEYEAFFAEGRADEFFVKNLENVQGDERDTIFFSIGYARTKEQKANGKPMAMRFGPLGMAGGERRLNVAITRAKINVKLVSSILPSDMDLSRTESAGVRMLRSYIEFAMNGEATLAKAQRNVRTDEFADAVAQFIRDQGFEVRQYVGCSGYKIDIAVRHPSKLVEQYVAGIECDGYSYASARTARDRDRLRSVVLTNMGWNLYRVWSAEWAKNPEVEGEKLIAFLRDAVRACDEKVRLLEEQKRSEETGRAEPEEEKALPIAQEEAPESDRAEAAEEDGQHIRRKEAEQKPEPIKAKAAEEEDRQPIRMEEGPKEAEPEKADIARKTEETGEREESEDSLIRALHKAGLRTMDNRAASSILWVLYAPEKKDAFEKIAAEYNVSGKLEKRGAIATNNVPAWRIMVK